MALENRASRRTRSADRRGAPTAPAPDSVKLSETELRCLSRLEGRPLPRSEALAEILGVSRNAAWRFIRRLRREGVLGFATRMRSRPDLCECVSYVKVDWSAAPDVEAIDALMRQDPNIVRADRIAGKSDFRLVSHHADYRAANAWTRAVMARPGVAQMTTNICRTIVDRFTYAEARLGSDAAAREGAPLWPHRPVSCGSPQSFIAPIPPRRPDVEASPELPT